MMRRLLLITGVIGLLAGGFSARSPVAERQVAALPPREEISAAPAATIPEQVVQQVVEAGGGVYAGECATTRSPQDLGKVCSTLMEERDDLRAYLTGRTFSEYSTWVFVRRNAGGWSAAGTAPLDFFATEPAIPWPHQ